MFNINYYYKYIFKLIFDNFIKYYSFKFNKYVFLIIWKITILRVVVWSMLF